VNNYPNYTPRLDAFVDKEPITAIGELTVCIACRSVVREQDQEKHTDYHDILIRILEQLTTQAFGELPTNIHLDIMNLRDGEL
jgi:hypothetical protein